MIRFAHVPLLVCGLLGALTATPARAQFDVVLPPRTHNPVVGEREALSHGLTRAWATRVGLDKSFEHIAGTYLDGMNLFVLTNQGLLHAIDTENGQTVWKTPIGSRNRQSLGPHANLKYVAVVNGSTLYLVDRHSGAQKWEVTLAKTPGAGPMLGQTRVYTPLLPGGVAAYDLATVEDPQALRVPEFYASSGPVELPLLLTRRSLVWAVSSGFVLSGTLSDFDARFRLQLGQELRAPMAARPPAIFVAARDQYVYAIDEMTGEVLWRFATGSSHTHPLVAIGDALYVIPDKGGMYCLDAESGKSRWWAPRADQFLAASAARVYVADVFGRTLILDGATGTLLEVIDTSRLDWKMTNVATDRLYVGTPDGVINCLHEIELDVPLLHQPPDVPEQIGEPAPTPDGDTPGGAGDEPADEAEPEAAEPDADDPFAQP